MWRNLTGFRLNAANSMRMLADIVLVLVGFLGTLVLTPRYSVGLILESNSTSWLPFLITLIVVSTASFIACGLYSPRYIHGRLWSKLRHVFYATTLAFGAFAFVLSFNKQLTLDKAAAYLGAWAAATALTMGARIARHLIKHDDQMAALNRKPVVPNRDRNILIIGGAGYIGSALVPKLLARGFHVTVLDLMAYGEEPIASFRDHANFRLVRGDFRNVATLVSLMRTAGAIIHLGGLVGDPACAVDEDLTIDINLTSTKLIGEVASAHGVSRLIFASSCSVYGANNEIVNEESVFNPQSLYARTKMASEAILSELSGDLCITYMRFATIYGISGRTRFDLVVNLLAAKAIRDKKITVFGSDQWRPFVHVEDVASALLLAVEAPEEKVSNVAFNVGSNEQNCTLGDLALRIQAMVPDAEIVTDDTVTDKRNYRVNFDRISKVLGFHPAWTLERGIQQVLDVVRSNQIGDYNDVSFSNLRFMVEKGQRFFERSVVSGWEQDYMQQTVALAAEDPEDADVNKIVALRRNP